MVAASSMSTTCSEFAETLATNYGLEVSSSTSWRALRRAKRPYKKDNVQLLSEKAKERRLQFAKHMLLRLQASKRKRIVVKGKYIKPLYLDKIVFQDEKLFRCKPVQNKQNDRLWLPSKYTKLEQSKDPGVADALKNKRKQNNPGIMVSATICSKALSSPHFVEAGVKINSESYCETLQDHILPVGYSWFPEGSWHYAHDGAPAHCSRKTKTFIATIAEDVELLDWPSSSPDINPLDYGMWSTIERRLGKEEPATTGWEMRLKAKIRAAFDSITAEDTKRIVEAWPKRLKAVVEAKGDHIEGVLLKSKKAKVATTEVDWF